MSFLGHKSCNDEASNSSFHDCQSQFPIGIDPGRFIRAIQLPQVKDNIEELKKRFSGRKVNKNSIPFHGTKFTFIFCLNMHFKTECLIF